MTTDDEIERLERENAGPLSNATTSTEGSRNANRH